MEAEKKNLMNAATWGIWVWVVLTVVPVVLVLLCCIGCFGMSIFGQAAEGVR